MFHAKSASNIKDMARHVVLFGSIPQFILQKPRSRQSNESTVGSSCTSLEFTICLVLMKIQRCRRCGNSAESQQLERAREHLNSARKHHGETIVERHLEDEQHQMQMHEQGYTSPTWKNVDRMGSVNTAITWPLLPKGLTTETNTRSCNTNKEEAATP